MASKSRAQGISKTAWIASMVGCAVLGSVVGNVAISWANRADSTVIGPDSSNPDLVIPYSGYLAVDGVALTSQGGTRAVRFRFYNTRLGVNSYTETHDVTFYDGKFSVSLGKGRDPSPSAETFEAMILNGDKIEFGIEVEDAPGSGTFVALSGRQTIEAAPYAAWSANAADFNTAGNLQVGGNANITGNIYANDLNAAQTVRATAVNADVYRPGYAAWNSLNTGDGDAAIYNDNATYKSLLISGNNSGGGVRKIDLYEDVRVDRDLTVNRDLSVDRDLTVTRDLDVGATVLALGVRTNSFKPLYQDYGTLSTGDGGAAIYNDAGTHQALVITGNRSSTNNTGDRKIKLYDDVTVNGDLNVTGKINGLSIEAEKSVSNASAASSGSSTIALGISSSEGFCFLVGMSWNPYNNTTNNHGGACYVDINASSQWQLTASSESATTQSCEARCIRF
jgi:hypothetical protein